MGLPGDITTAEIIRRLRRLHLCHLQFLSYGKDRRTNVQWGKLYCESRKRTPERDSGCGQIVFEMQLP